MRGYFLRPLAVQVVEDLRPGVANVVGRLLLSLPGRKGSCAPQTLAFLAVPVSSLPTRD